MSYVSDEKKRMASNVACNYQNAYNLYGDNFADYYKKYLKDSGYDANGCRYRDGTTSFVNVCNVVCDYFKSICPIVKDAQANADCASATEQSMVNDAIAARQAGINAGMGKARAGLLGDSSSATNAISTGNNAYSSSIQNQGSTQADYLAKMGQACALCNCAQNMNNGALMNALGAAFQGAGSGASLGASLAGGSK
jgi:hypothetical protein